MALPNGYSIAERNSTVEPDILMQEEVGLIETLYNIPNEVVVKASQDGVAYHGNYKITPIM